LQILYVTKIVFDLKETKIQLGIQQFSKQKKYLKQIEGICITIDKWHRAVHLVTPMDTTNTFFYSKKWMKTSTSAEQGINPLLQEQEKLTELEVLPSFKMPLSISIVAAHFWSPAAKQRTATHLAIEDSACLARPPDCDGLAAEIRESNKASKLVFADWTSEAKNL